MSYQQADQDIHRHSSAILSSAEYPDGDQKQPFSSCRYNLETNLDSHLIFAPKPVLEYAVVHEMCHLRNRNHDPEFWQLVGQILPDWEARKSWLDKNEHLLGWEKLEPALPEAAL